MQASSFDLQCHKSKLHSIVHELIHIPDLSKTAQASNDTSINSSSIIYQLSTDSEFAFILEEYLSLASGNGASSGEGE